MKNISNQPPLIAALKLPMIMLTLTVGVYVAYYYNYVMAGAILMLSLVVCLIGLLGGLFGGLYGIFFGKEKLDRQFVMLSVSIVIPVLLIPGLIVIEYASAYVMARFMEPYLQHQAESTSIRHSDTNSSFKYFRLNFGVVPGGGRWLVYDESDQVSLDYMERSAEWWNVSKEYADGESCISNGNKIYSHYYFQYATCG